MYPTCVSSKLCEFILTWNQTTLRAKKIMFMGFNICFLFGLFILDCIHVIKRNFVAELYLVLLHVGCSRWWEMKEMLGVYF